MNLAKDFLTQSRQDAKKRESNLFASLRLCVSPPSPSLWFMVPMRANFGVEAPHEPQNRSRANLQLAKTEVQAFEPRDWAWGNSYA